VENRRLLFVGTLIYERCLTITTSDHARQGRSSLKGASDLSSSVERRTNQVNGFLTCLADHSRTPEELDQYGLHYAQSLKAASLACPLDSLFSGRPWGRCDGWAGLFRCEIDSGPIALYRRRTLDRDRCRCGLSGGGATEARCRVPRLPLGWFGARRPGKIPRNDGLQTMQPDNNVRCQRLFITQHAINV
jgi:hypothetical protein